MDVDARRGVRGWVERHPETLRFLAMFVVLALSGYGFISYVDHKDNQRDAIAQAERAEIERVAREELRSSERRAREDLRDAERDAREELRNRINQFARGQCLASRQPGSTLQKFNQAMIRLGQPDSVLPVPTVERCNMPIIPPPAGNPGTQGEE